MTISDKQIKEVENIEQAVAHFFNIKVDGIIDKTSKRQESLARSFVFYILHVDMHLSVGCISKRYNRGSNAIFKSLSKIKYRIDKLHSYKEMYFGICNERKMIVSL